MSGQSDIAVCARPVPQILERCSIGRQRSALACLQRATSTVGKLSRISSTSSFGRGSTDCMRTRLTTRVHGDLPRYMRLDATQAAISSLRQNTASNSKRRCAYLCWWFARRRSANRSPALGGDACATSRDWPNRAGDSHGTITRRRQCQVTGLTSTTSSICQRRGHLPFSPFDTSRRLNLFLSELPRSKSRPTWPNTTMTSPAAWLHTFSSHSSSLF